MAGILGWVTTPAATANASCNDTRAGYVEQGVIASGVGGPWSSIQLADINGDKKADYVVVDPTNGSLEVWLN